MLARRENCGPEYDGQYIVGVKTTGVYCLPSCRPPRLAKAENIEFFATPHDAREAGLRPCKLCRPDDFYLGLDAGELLVEHLVSRISRHPEQYCTARAMVCDSGVANHKLHELFRVHYHTTPSERPTRKNELSQHGPRLLLEHRRTASDIAFDVGFRKPFHVQRKLPEVQRYDTSSLTGRWWAQPDLIRMIRETTPSDACSSYLGRTRKAWTEQVCGRTYRTAMRAGGQTVIIEVAFQQGRAQCRVQSDTRWRVLISPASTNACLQLRAGRRPCPVRVTRRRRPEVSGLISGQRGLRVPLAPDPFDGLLWAICGQQAGPPHAFTLRRRLIERAGSRIAPGLYLPPEPARVACLEPGDLEHMGFSGELAGHLIGAAQAVATNRIDLHGSANPSATRLERDLRGLDGWAALGNTIRVDASLRLSELYAGGR